MKKWIAILSFCTVAARSQAEPEIKGTPSEVAQYLQGISKSVTVVGEEELKVTADHANVSLRAVTESKSLQDALRQNQDVRSKIIASLKDKGIDAEHVQASRFSSTPKYGLFGDKPKSYKVENVIKITVQSEKEFQAVAALVDVMPEVRYDGIEFASPDKDAWKTRAVTQAIDKADERKRLYEEKLGIKLAPKSISEGGVAMQANQAYGFHAGLYALSSAPRVSPEPAPVVAAANEEAANDFGEVIYRAQVTVEYTVETK